MYYGTIIIYYGILLFCTKVLYVPRSETWAQSCLGMMKVFGNLTQISNLQCDCFINSSNANGSSDGPDTGWITPRCECFHLQHRNAAGRFASTPYITVNSSLPPPSVIGYLKPGSSEHAGVVSGANHQNSIFAYNRFFQASVEISKSRYFLWGS